MKKIIVTNPSSHNLNYVFKGGLIKVKANEKEQVIELAGVTDDKFAEALAADLVAKFGYLKTRVAGAGEVLKQEPLKQETPKQETPKQDQSKEKNGK